MLNHIDIFAAQVPKLFYDVFPYFNNTSIICEGSLELLCFIRV